MKRITKYFFDKHSPKLKSEVLFDVTIAFIVRILGAMSGFSLSLYLGRQLGAYESGFYFLAFSVITVLAAVSPAGFDNSVVRFVGAAFPENNWKLIRQVAAKTLKLTLGVSAFFATVLWLSAPFLAESVFSKPELGMVLKAMSIGLIGLAGFTLLARMLQGLRKTVTAIFILSIVANLLVIILIYSFDVINAKVAAWAFSAASIFTLLIGGFLFWRSLGQGGGEITWAELFQSSLPLLVVVLMTQSTQWSGQLIAGAWVESEQIAQLAVAQRTALMTSFILMAVNLVVAPRFASLYKQGKRDELEKLALTSVKLMVVFALPVVIFMLVFPEWLMSLFGEGFSGGALLLQILVVGQFVNVATGSVGYLLMMSGHERDLRNTVLFSGPLALILGFCLVPVYGAVGAAIATAIAIATQNLIAVWMVKRRLGFNTLAVWR